MGRQGKCDRTHGLSGQGINPENGLGYSGLEACAKELGATDGL